MELANCRNLQVKLTRKGARVKLTNAIHKLFQRERGGKSTVKIKAVIVLNLSKRAESPLPRLYVWIYRSNYLTPTHLLLTISLFFNDLPAVKGTRREQIDIKCSYQLRKHGQIGCIRQKSAVSLSGVRGSIHG